MSRFLSESARSLAPYVPGEQPRDQAFVKLNTNECPYAPSLLVRNTVAAFNTGDLRLYPDPEAKAVKEAAAKAYGLSPDQIFAGGGSDEVLAYAFMAFFERGDKVLFPDITYGFYKVYGDLFQLDIREVPLSEDFTVNLFDYFSAEGNIFLANPNAPTGIALTTGEIEEILRHNPDRLVVIDEAYIDFAATGSCVPLINTYDNLLVVQTFSKSRALAGMRIGFGFGNPELMAGLERIKYSFNPYNLDRLSMEVAIASLQDRDYTRRVAARIAETREKTVAELTGLGFRVLPSGSNFLFAEHPGMEGGALYRRLKEKGVLVRHFDKPRISSFLRISIGTEEEMKALLRALREIL